MFDAAAAVVVIMAIPDSSVQGIDLRRLSFSKSICSVSELHNHEVTILGSNTLGQYRIAGLFIGITLPDPWVSLHNISQQGV